MHTDAITNADGQRTQVGADPLDYVLRYAASDYDCYFRGRYIGSRPTLPKAIEAIEYEQTKAARHPQPPHVAESSIASYQDELRAITTRLHDLAGQLATCPAEHPRVRTQLMLAHIHASTALRSLQDAERSLRLAESTPDRSMPLDAAA
jgi:hypothetical protein